MKKNEPIQQILRPDVITVHVGQNVSDVRKLLVEHGFHHVPVVSGKKLIGLISAANILAVSVHGVGSDQRSMDAYLDNQFSIEGIMQKNVRTLPPNSTIAEVADALSDGSTRAIPIVDDEKNLVGLVTSTDLIRYLRDLF